MNNRQVKVQDAFVELLQSYIHVILGYTAGVDECYQQIRQIEEFRPNFKVSAIKTLRTWSKQFGAVTTFTHSLASSGPLKVALGSCHSRFDWSEDLGTVTIGRRVGLKEAKDFIDLYFAAMDAVDDASQL